MKCFCKILSGFVFLLLMIVGGINNEISANNSISRDSIFNDLQIKIRAYNSAKLKKNWYATILESLNQDGIVNDSSLYVELIFHLASNAISNHKLKDAENLLDIAQLRISAANIKAKCEKMYWQALIYYYRNDFAKSDSIVNQATHLFSFICSDELKGLIFYHQARSINYQDGLEKAIPYYLKAEEYLDDDHIKSFYAKRRIIAYHTKKGDFTAALKYINSVVDRCMPSNTLLDSNNNLEDSRCIGRYARFLQSRAYLYREMAKESDDSLTFLQKSYMDGRNSVIAIEKLKKQLNFESDILNENRRTEYIYYKSIEAVSRLYYATKADSLFNKIFVYSEMEKASALLRGIQKENSLQNSDLPDSLVARAYNLQKQLLNTEAAKYRQNADYNITDSKLVALNNNYYHLVKEVNDFEENLEKKYSVYRDNKYKVLEPDLEFVKELSNNKNIIEYVLSDEKIYAVLIRDSSFYFYDKYFDKGFRDSIILYHKQISNGGNLSFSVTEQNCFIQLSHYLYNELIKPFSHKLNVNKPLLIVPDNELSLIPFETLLTNGVMPKRVNYENLPYLIQDYDISYTYSITLLEIQSKAKTDRNIQKVFAMAPGYGSSLPDSDQGLNTSDFRDSLGPLKGAQKEVELIKKKLKGKHYFNKEATEEEFKNKAGKYSILHLAMHTLINDEEPLYSKLIFTPDADSIEDGVLNTYELKGLSLNADLVVLSACNTGNGKINNGEGIIGLSRGFLQAGCRSLLATLWSVSDMVSFEIMNGFYANIKQNNDLALSLANSKRAYLTNNQGFYTHPFFWSGFIVIGSTDPIINNTMHPISKIVLGLLVVIVLIIVLARVYKRKKPEGFRLPVKLNKRN